MHGKALLVIMLFCLTSTVLAISSFAEAGSGAKEFLQGRWQHISRDNRGKSISVPGFAKTDELDFSGSKLTIRKTKYHVAPDGVCLVGNRRHVSSIYSFSASKTNGDTYKVSYQDNSGLKKWAVVKIGKNFCGQKIIAIRWNGARTVDHYRLKE